MSLFPLFFWLECAVYTTWHPEDLPPTKSYVNSLGKICLIRTMMDGDYRITTGTIEGLVEAVADLHTPGFEAFAPRDRRAWLDRVLTRKGRTAARGVAPLQTPRISTIFCSRTGPS